MYQPKEHLLRESPSTRTERPRNFFEAIATQQSPRLGTALTIPSTAVAQIMGQTRCDFVLIDMEHSPIAAESMTQMVHTIVASSRGSCFPIVRVPSQGVEWIKWALDSGAAGIILPMVNNRAQMEKIIECSLFPPRGRRSFGPARAPWGLPDGPQGGVAQYFERAMNEEVAIFPMIESVEGVENAEEIISVPGVSGVFIGPIDLRLSLGLTGANGVETPYIEALEKIHQVAKKHNRILGSVSIGEGVIGNSMFRKMDFLVVAVDSGILTQGFNNDLIRAREMISKSRVSL